MLKGFVSGLAVSALALAALSLAVPLLPDPAAGSPAPAPVLLPGAGNAPLRAETTPAALPVIPAPTAPRSDSPAPTRMPAAGAEPAALQVAGRLRPPSLADRQHAVAPEAQGGDELAVALPSAMPTTAAAPPRSPAPAADSQRNDAAGHDAAPARPRMLMSFPAPAPVVAKDALPLRPILINNAQPAPAPTWIPVTDLRTDRLPQIGVAPPVESLQQGRVAAHRRHAMDFAPPGDNRPLIAAVLVHDGILPNLPVTLAFDPLAPGAAEAAASWRAGGGEVAILATGLPSGASARDAEVTLQSHLRSLPEAVALVDLPEGGIARDRVLAAQVIAILAEDGHGLVTHGAGLNTPARMAESVGVAAVAVTSLIRAEDAPAATRRMLDRGALRASQDGRAVIFATATPEVLDLLADWFETGRGRDLSLAPLSALLDR